MRPKWLILLVPALAGLAALLLSGAGTPSNATVARIFSAGQWKVSTRPNDLRCALVADLDQRGPLGRAVVALLERLDDSGLQWSGPARCAATNPIEETKQVRTEVTVHL